MVGLDNFKEFYSPAPSAPGIDLSDSILIITISDASKFDDIIFFN